LHWICINNQLELFKFFISLNPYLDLIDNNGMRALDYCIVNNNFEMIWVIFPNPNHNLGYYQLRSITFFIYE